MCIWRVKSRFARSRQLSRWSRGTDRQAAIPSGVTLRIQDLTELDSSAHPAVSGLGAIGDGNGRGVHVHTTLAYQPASDHVVGVAFQQTSTRTTQSPLNRAQRRRRMNRQCYGLSSTFGSPGIAILSRREH